MTGLQTGFDATVHASTVAVGDAGVIIVGASGTGKSALALQLMALGAVLVADDQTCLTATDLGVMASAPNALLGLIEARGLGILRSATVPQVRLVLMVDLDHAEAERHPPRRSRMVHGHDIDLVFGNASAHFPASLMCYVAGGRLDDV
jgi:HPr kinase/phosphorylase